MRARAGMSPAKRLFRFLACAGGLVSDPIHDHPTILPAMANFTDLVYAIQLESTNSWIYTVIAILLGLLHPFEPGSQGEAAADLIRRKSGNAGMAGRASLTAALHDTALLWVVAATAVFAGNVDLGLQEKEPYILLVSGGFIIVTAFRLFNLHQMKLEPSYLVSASAFAGLGHVAAPVQSAPSPEPVARWAFSRFLPSPSVMALLLLCMQIDFLDSGAAIAFAFCAGLACSLALLGIGAGLLSANSGLRRSHDVLSAALPYVSVFLVIAIGLLSFVHGLTDLGL